MFHEDGVKFVSAQTFHSFTVFNLIAATLCQTQSASGGAEFDHLIIDLEFNEF